MGGECHISSLDSLSYDGRTYLLFIYQVLFNLGYTQCSTLLRQIGIVAALIMAEVVIISNNNKERVSPFAAKLGLPFTSMSCKPLPFKYIKGMKMLGGSRKNTAMACRNTINRYVGVSMALAKKYCDRIICRSVFYICYCGKSIINSSP